MVRLSTLKAVLRILFLIRKIFLFIFSVKASLGPFIIVWAVGSLIALPSFEFVDIIWKVSAASVKKSVLPSSSSDRPHHNPSVF